LLFLFVVFVAVAVYFIFRSSFVRVISVRSMNGSITSRGLLSNSSTSVSSHAQS